MTSAGTTPGRLERRKARTRAAIVSAASQLFRRRGYEETSIQHIAEVADTGVGTLYGYFSSKEEILREVLQTERTDALDRFFAGIAETSSHIDRACMAVAVLANYLKDNRTILVSAFQVGARNQQIDEAQSEWVHASFCRMIRDGIAAGEFRDVPVEPTVRMLVGTTILAALGIGNWAGLQDRPETLTELAQLTRSVLAK